MLKYVAVASVIMCFLFIHRGYCETRYKDLNINGRTFRLEVADTQEKRESGLSGRNIEQNEGMLFVFEKPVRPVFWMKDVFEPLDIIWVDDKNIVVGVLDSLPVCHGPDLAIYRPPVKIRSAIELKGGVSEKLKIKIGQVLDI